MVAEETVVAEAGAGSRVRSCRASGGGRLVAAVLPSERGRGVNPAEAPGLNEGRLRR